MGMRSAVVLRIDGAGDPRAVAAIINLFSDQVWPGRGFGARATAQDLTKWGTPTTGYEVTAVEVSWGIYLDFPDMVATALADHEDEDGQADPLPLVAIDWHQDGYGAETTDWELRARPNSQGTYDTDEVSLVLGDRFLIESTARRLVQAHQGDPAAAIAALLAEFDGVPALG